MLKKIIQDRAPTVGSVIRPLSVLAAAFLISTAMGCAPSGPTKYPVKGEVRFNNKLIESGTMTLIPKSPTARTAVAKIVNGKYSMEVPAGNWTVNIQAVRLKQPDDPELRDPPREQYIPAKYNGDSTLQISVPSDQKEINYDLEP